MKILVKKKKVGGEQVKFPVEEFGWKSSQRRCFTSCVINDEVLLTWRQEEKQVSWWVGGQGQDEQTHGIMNPAGELRGSLGCHRHESFLLFRFGQLQS